MNTNIDSLLAEVVQKSRITELDRLIEFETFCGQAEGKSPKTIEMTVLALRKLKAFLETNRLPTDAGMTTADDIRAFILHLQGCRKFERHPYARVQEQGLSPQSVNCYMRALRAAWNRWVAEGLVDSSPFGKVKVPKAPKKVMPAFSPEQIVALLGAIETSTPTGFRDHLLIHVYLDTGCRLSEIAGVTVKDVDLNGRCLRVAGKGGHERVVPFGVTVAKLLWKYINVHRPEPMLSQYDYLFLTLDGRPLSKNRVWAIVHKHGRKAGITGVRCSPHTLRHTTCLMWFRSGGDIFSLQRITGHSSLEVLKGYLNLAQSDVNTAHRRHSPVDNLKMGDRYAKS